MMGNATLDEKKLPFVPFVLFVLFVPFVLSFSSRVVFLIPALRGGCAEGRGSGRGAVGRALWAGAIR